MNITLRLPKKTFSNNQNKEKKILEINQEKENKKCFDCQSFNIQYISLFNGIFICPKCYNDYHKNLDSNISLILDNDLQKLSLQEIQYLYYGGNKKLSDFINYEYPNLKFINRKKLYLTKAMEYYRQWIKYLINAKEKPLKPSIEESSELITNSNYNNSQSARNRKISRGINIDFINNYYNYENQDSTINRKINPDLYKKIIKTNFVNALNYSQGYDNSTNDKEREINNFTNNINTEGNRYERLILDNENNYYNKEIEFYNENNKINKKIIDLGKISNNSNNTNKNKLITKRLKLKNSNYFKNKNKGLNMSRNEENNKIKNKGLVNILTKENSNIYIKPTHTLLNSFQRNAPQKNRLENISGNRHSLMQTNINYQTNLINYNNTFDILMNDMSDRANYQNDNMQIYKIQNYPSGKALNSIKMLNFSNIDNDNYNYNYNNTINNNENKIFKKKTLKNSFSISKRRKKNNDDDSKTKINNSVAKRNNFEIFSDNIFDKTLNENKHIKIISNINNLDDDNLEKSKSKDIISEIKVKRRNKYIIEQNNFNNTINDFNHHRILKTEENILNKDYNKNIILLKDNEINTKEKKIDKLLTLTRLVKNKERMSIPKLSQNNTNNTLINENKSKLSETIGEKNKGFEAFKITFLLNKNNKKKQNIIKRKAKEIFLMENTGKTVRMFKTENNNNKSNDILSEKLNFKPKNIEIMNINQIKRNRNLNQDKEKIINNNQEYKIQRHKKY